MSNTEDWRYKNAGLIAFSQIGDYVDDAQKIAPMIPVLLQHMQHENPKIRYAALHCVGALSCDMEEKFFEEFHMDVLPALIQSLDDQTPRVQSIACAAISNFTENAEKEIMLPHVQLLSQKFCNMVQNGISITKENAVTALANVVEKVGDSFDDYFNEAL